MAVWSPYLVAARCPRYPAARKVFDEMRQVQRPDVCTFNALLHAAARDTDGAKAAEVERIVKEMQEAG
eukprot:2108931-Pyramimonas_sp.AAC.1